jgi:hypothetical protein
MRIVIPLCLLLLFVPIYLWKVQGINPFASDEGGNGNAPNAPLDTGPSRVDSIEHLAKTDPVELLRNVLAKYKEAGIKGYTCILAKHERINGKVNAPEVTECWFKEEPFSVFMHWKEGAGLAAASLYVVGENDGKMCVRPSSAAGKLLGWVKRAPDSSEAKESTRYLITEFGLRCGTERTYRVWKAMQDRGVKLQTEYLGVRKNVEEVGGRDCHVLVRHCDPPEEEGLTEITLLIDAETWQQVGTVLKAGNDLIGTYYFRDIKVNPSFEDKQFKPEALKKY